MSDSSLHTTQLHAWLDRIRGGDQAAQDELLRAVCNRLEVLAAKMLKQFPNVGRWVETDDVLQNALMRLLRTLQQLKPDSVRGFYNLAAEHIRRELLDLARHFYGPEGVGANHHSHGPERDATTPAFEVAAAGDTPDDLDKWCRFHREVEKLPGELRETVSLIFYHGWTQPQVAELFQVNERTVRRRWQEALLALRESLQEGLPSS